MYGIYVYANAYVCVCVSVRAWVCVSVLGLIYAYTHTHTCTYTHTHTCTHTNTHQYYTASNWIEFYRARQHRFHCLAQTGIQSCHHPALYNVGTWFKSMSLTWPCVTDMTHWKFARVTWLGLVKQNGQHRERLNKRDGERAHENVIARAQAQTGEKAARGIIQDIQNRLLWVYRTLMPVCMPSHPPGVGRVDGLSPAMDEKISGPDQ